MGAGSQERGATPTPAHRHGEADKCRGETERRDKSTRKNRETTGDTATAVTGLGITKYLRI